MKAKKLSCFSILSTVFILTLLVGCQSAPASSSGVVPANQPVRIAEFIPVKANDWTQAFTDGANVSAKKLNATITVYDCEFDQKLQIEQMQDAITAGIYNAFLLNAVDNMGVVPGVDAAVKAGIKVGLLDTPVGPNVDEIAPYDGVTTIAGMAWKTVGTGIGQMVVNACQGKDPCNLYFIIGVDGMTADAVRVNALKAILASHPNIKLIGMGQGAYDQNASLTLMQDVVGAHPDLNVVATASDQGALGAWQAINNAGLSSKIVVLGMGASREAVQSIKNGQIAGTFAAVPYTVGQTAAENVILAARGKPFQSAVDVSKLSPPFPPGGPTITKDNVGQFTAQW